MKECYKNRYIVHLIDVHIVNNSFLWIVIEFMDAGTLTDILEEHEHVQMVENEIARVCNNVLKALHFLHFTHRIHRDVKSDNIFIKKNGEIKLGEFGFSAQLTKKKEKKLSDRHSLLDGS